VTTAVRAMGIDMTGFLSKFGIIIFIAPRKTAIGTPLLLTLAVPTTRHAAAAIPTLAAPEAIPEIPIAIAIATVEIGETMRILNAIAIRIHINNGCKLVKLFIFYIFIITLCEILHNRKPNLNRFYIKLFINLSKLEVPKHLKYL